jgi:hypothetical protein
MTGIYGQDWSSYQSANPATAGLSFVFIKVTEGTSYINPLWAQQRDHAKANGLIVGFYAYPHMGNSYQAEADYFLSQVNWQPGDIAILDWEGYDSANSGIPHSTQAAYKDNWLRYVKSKLPNNPVGMYCNTDYWRNVDTTNYCGDFLWIATAGLPAGQPGITHPWMFHQYSGASMDLDYCALSSTAALKAWTLSFDKTTTPQEDDLPYTEAQLTNIVQQAVISQPVRDALAYANFYFLEEIFSMKPIANPSGAQVLVNQIQTELSPVLGKLDPSVLAELQTAMTTAIKNTAITATINVNGTVK